MSIVLVVGLLFSPALAQGTKVVVWSYYIFPPFIVTGSQGLNQDFIDLLNGEARGEFLFHLDVMPRKRIDLHLERNEPGVVLFVNPTWIHPPGHNNVVWTPPLFADRNAIISNVSRKVHYDGPASVRGLIMGGVFGRKYKGLEKAIARGDIIRKDTNDEELNVLKLAERRIDFMTAPESVLHYLVARLGVEDRIYFSPTPLFEYTRHLLINNGSPELETFLVNVINTLPENPVWQEIRERYFLN